MRIGKKTSILFPQMRYSCLWGGMYREGSGIAIGFLNPEIPHILALQSLTFSLSKNHSEPTKDLHIAFLIWIRGKTTFGNYESKRSLLTLTVPTVGDFQTCDFTKATIEEADLTDRQLESRLNSLGISLEPSKSRLAPVALPSAHYESEDERKAKSSP